MQKTLSKLNGKCFKYCGNIFSVIETKIVNQKAVVKTNRQTFVKTESELNVFMDDIEFVKGDKVSFVPAKKDIDTKTPFLNDNAAKESHDVEIMQSADVQAKMIDKLMGVFDEISKNPTEETYKRAKAMVDVSGAVVSVQVLQLRLKMLTK